MTKCLFVSCAEEDASWITKITKWAEKGKLEEETVIYSQAGPKEGDGYDLVRKGMVNYIRDAELVLILVGDEGHNTEWLRTVLDIAESFKKPVVNMRIPFSETPTHNLLNSFEEISFNPNAVVKVVKKLGKSK